MSKRKEGQKKGYLGHRSHGRGNVKNRRGSGNRGGRGMAGIDKHKWSWAMKYDKNHFDKHGFVRPQGTSVDVDTINLYYINQRAMLNQLEKKNGKLYFEFDGKILAVGNLSVPVVIRASAWSKGVEAKVKTAGGELVKLGKAAAKPAA